MLWILFHSSEQITIKIYLHRIIWFNWILYHDDYSRNIYLIITWQITNLYLWFCSFSCICWYFGIAKINAWWCISIVATWCPEGSYAIGLVTWHKIYMDVKLYWLWQYYIKDTDFVTWKNRFFIWCLILWRWSQCKHYII